MLAHYLNNLLAPLFRLGYLPAASANRANQASFRVGHLELRWLHYLLALSIPFVFIKSELLLGLVRPGGTPALTVLLIPISLSALLGGVWPGLAATFAAAVGADLFLLAPPRGGIAGTSDTLAWFGLVAAGVLLSTLSGMLHRARNRSAARARRSRFLATAGAVLARSLDYEETLQTISKLVTEEWASRCLIYLLAEDGSAFLATYAPIDPILSQHLADAGAYLTSKRPGVTHPVVETMNSGRSIFVPVVSEAWIAANAVSDEHERSLQEPGIHSMLIVPIVDPSGRSLGALKLLFTADDRRQFDESDLAFAEELGQRAGSAVTTARLYEYESAYRRMVETTHDGVIMLDTEQRIRFVNSRMISMLGHADDSQIAGRPLVEFLSPTDAAGAPERLARRQQGITEHSELCFRRRDGSDLWTLATASPLVAFGGGRTGARSLKMITDITERKRAEAELAENAQRLSTLADERQHAASHDTLTGLPNRTFFVDRLGQALERMKRQPALVAAVLFVDLDHFKVINDSLGHSAGDQLLALFAERLMSGLRPYDTVARLGGDEFAILLDDVASVQAAVLAAERVLLQIKGPFRVEGREVSITASIGIAFGKPGDNAAAVLRDADTAMYRAKDLGRGRFVCFVPEMHARAMARLELEIKLREALDRGELRLAYQPIYNLETGRLTGFEALARWEDAGEMVSPNIFIPLAEETGLIHPLGEWALAEACRQARLWRDLRPQGRPLTLSVNVSAKQLSADLRGEVARVLAQNGLRPQDLRLEITASVLMEPGEAVEMTLAQVRALGVMIDLNHFGIGYSSLGNLHRLAVSTLKIDRSFISGGGSLGLSELEIVQAIIALAHSLGLGISAAGVETATQVSQLKALGCTNAQGDFLSLPLDEAGARALVAA